MLPSSHVVPINRAGLKGLDDPRTLADAFSEFMSASAQLETSYRALQQEVSHLSFELAERNCELTRSLAENNRMRTTLQKMLDSMPCGVFVLNTDERIVMINPEGRRLLGLGSAPVRTLSDLSQSTRVDFDSLTAFTKEGRDTEVCTTPGGERRWLAVGRRELGCDSHTESAEARLRSVWILRDVTAEKRAEEEREAARRTATLAEISTVLAHEIRNPLASLELFAGLIGDDPEANQEWVSNIRAGIRMLSGTVNNVLNMQGESISRLAVVDLVAAIRGGVSFVAPIAEQAGVQLEIKAERTALPVNGNEEAIRQIILNLVCNAIRHTPQGGRIEVSIRHVAGQNDVRAIVEVSDTGCGIGPEHLPHIFEAGFSGSGQTPGIGLAVCRRLVAKHGGSISVSSCIGEGSNFQVEFPAL